MKPEDHQARIAADQSRAGVAKPSQSTAHSEEDYLLSNRSLRGSTKGSDPADQRKRGDLQKRHPEALNQRPPRRPN